MSARKNRQSKKPALRLVAPATRPHGDADQDPADDEKRADILDVIEETHRLGLAKVIHEPGTSVEFARDLLQIVTSKIRFNESDARLLLDTLARNLDGDALDLMHEMAVNQERIMIECYPDLWRLQPGESALLTAMRARAAAAEWASGMKNVEVDRVLRDAK